MIVWKLAAGCGVVIARWDLAGEIAVGRMIEPFLWFLYWLGCFDQPEQLVHFIGHALCGNADIVVVWNDIANRNVALAAVVHQALEIREVYPCFGTSRGASGTQPSVQG
ncbi:hypothetical protein [Mesorhizobium sp. B2-6-2]|uniref:hypothetical protein n=1 Tax=Mesorhizobium sp. B2-6-2 TaxID=2589915 RepID=UPI001129D916|nr:hypothetical protein [Mesorhizobium sp. B2-6-2]TPJ79177.1 hypothetical protein FJ419_11835 [Mesorhizobium sp. B2-6-2]